MPELTLDTIKSWLKEHPDLTSALLNEIQNQTLPKPDPPVITVEKSTTPTTTDNPDATPKQQQQQHTSSSVNSLADVGNWQNSRQLSADILFDVARTIYSSLDLKAIISKILSIAVTLVRAERCSILLLDESTNELYSMAWDVEPDQEVVAEFLAKHYDHHHHHHNNNSSNNSKSSSNLSAAAGTEAALLPTSAGTGEAGGAGGTVVTAAHDQENAEEIDVLSNSASSSLERFPMPATHTPTTNVVAISRPTSPSKSANPGFRFKIGIGVAGHVAATGKGLNIRDAYLDPRFNKEMDLKTGFRTKSMMCLPIYSGNKSVDAPKGKILGVATLINKLPSANENEPEPEGPHPVFNNDDVKCFKDFLVIVGVALNNSIIYERMKQKENESAMESRKSRILLELAHSLYSEENMQDLCRRIIIHARDLTGADRASIFLCDNDRKEMYSTVFDGSQKRMTFPMGVGIAGFVALNRLAVNLPNAYDDSRFNREMDKQTGYHTQSLLCSPIFGPTREIVGVANLINKTTPEGNVVPFSKDDEEVFEAFSTFCGLALHKAMMVEEIKNQRQRLAIAMEVMSYHATARLEDVVMFYQNVGGWWMGKESDPANVVGSPTVIKSLDRQNSIINRMKRAKANAASTINNNNSNNNDNNLLGASAAAGNKESMVVLGSQILVDMATISTHLNKGPGLLRLPTVEELRQMTFDPHRYTCQDDTLVGIVCRMFQDLGFCEKYEIPEEQIVRYVLTVRKNYRTVAYHNFTHAVSVVHATYIMIRNGMVEEGKFGIDTLDAFGIFLAALNHDIDHRGTNNQFQKTASTLLASFYSTSIMERHHFNHALSILNSKGHNILERVPSEQYKKCLFTIEQCILATDLAMFFKNRKATLELGQSKKFDPNNNEHKNLLMGIIMTTSDLSAMYKKWEDARHTSDAVYSEFFAQGVQENALGLPYSSELTNPLNETKIPKMQLDFYLNIVTPAFDTLYALVGDTTKDLLNQVKDNEQRWKELAESGNSYRMEIEVGGEDIIDIASPHPSKVVVEL